jgi:hypothetical protein
MILKQISLSISVNFSTFVFDKCQYVMTLNRNKNHLIKGKERGLSHRELRDKFKISIGAVSNILKRKKRICS